MELFPWVLFLFLTWLIYFYQGNSTSLTNVSNLPAVNAMLNSGSSLFLIMGFIAIKRNQVLIHRTMMIGALVFSTLFLICYIYYHHIHGNTPFLSQGWIRPIYFFILISHIILSGVILPLILTTFYFAFTNKFERHKKWAKYTLPLWLYVSVTGVLIFFFLKYFNNLSV